MLQRGTLSRRGFLRSSAAALTAAGLPAWYADRVVADEVAKDKPAAGDKLVMGAIGIGSPQSRGRAIYGEAKKKENNVVYAAACDVDARHLDNALAMMKKDGFEAKGYEAYQDLLNDKSIRAVTIATPDHWHAIIAIAALKAGKDVYCEKPLTLTIAEAEAVMAAAKKTGRIFQTGSQQRCEMVDKAFPNVGKFRLAAELVRNGRVGKIPRSSAGSAATRRAARSPRPSRRRG